MAVIVLLLGVWWLTMGFGGGPCPTLQSRQILATSQTSLQPGLRNADVYPFFVNADSNRACGAALLGPYLSGWVSFGGCSITPGGSMWCHVGNVSVYYPSDWTNITEGSNATPTWCYPEAPSCVGSSEANFSTQAVGKAIKGPLPSQYPLDLVIWSNQWAVISAHVTFSWEQ